ncbi:hypothetical protein LCGC14_2854230, partial [marine sediment metagenome]
MAKQSNLNNLRRSLKYLWPYRARLMLAGLCIVMVAVLWGGSIGMIGPIFQVLLDKDGIGLHGWAHSRIANESLGGKFPTFTSPGKGTADQAPIVLNVANIDKDGPAGKAGIVKGEWLIGLADDPNNRTMRGTDLLRHIAQGQPGDTVNLRVMDPTTQQIKPATIVLGTPKWSSVALFRILSYVPEPRSNDDKFTIYFYVLCLMLGLTL